MIRPFAAIPLGLLVLASSALIAADAALDVQIKDVRKQSTLMIKKKVKRSQIGAALGQMLPQVGAFLGTKKIAPLSPPVTVYTESAGDEFEIEAGFVVPDGTTGQGDIAASTLPAGKAACAIHIGSYEKLAETYDKMKAVLKAKGFKEKGLSWELYISDPGSTKPEELKTEIYLLVEDKH